MAKTLIELAYSYGDVFEDENDKYCGVYFSNAMIDAFSRALVAPYVEALEKYRKDEMDGLGAVFNTPAKEVLAANREMFGGE